MMPVYLYLCHSVPRREELAESFNRVFEPSIAQIVRWRDCPSPNKQFIAICNETEPFLKDVRGKLLQRAGVRILSSDWLQACIRDKTLSVPQERPRLMLPSKLPAEFETPPQLERKKLPSVQIVYQTPRNLPWTKAQDDLIKIIHELRRRREYVKAVHFEGILVDKFHTRKDVQDRERELFPS